MKLQFKPRFFSAHELATIYDWMKECQTSSGLSKTPPGEARENWTVHPESTLKEKMENFFLEKIEPLIPPPKSYQLDFEFAFHGNYSGYGIHTDAGYDPDEIIFQQGIIPLKITPLDSKVHTVIMNQQCFHSSAFPNISKDLELQKRVGGLDFDNPEIQKNYSLFWENSDFRKQQMKGFSIQFPFQWKLGDTVIWNRSYIHCSSDFSVSKTQYKEGLMWISRLTPTNH